MTEIDGRHALVTGGNRGIGRSTERVRTQLGYKEYPWPNQYLTAKQCERNLQRAQELAGTI